MNKFNKHITYRHDTSSSILDIRVISVYHVNSERTDLRIEYVHRSNGRIQYTGKGQNGHTDKVSIKSSDYKYWRALK